MRPAGQEEEPGRALGLGLGFACWLGQPSLNTEFPSRRNIYYNKYGGLLEKDPASSEELQPVSCSVVEGGSLKSDGKLWRRWRRRWLLVPWRPEAEGGCFEVRSCVRARPGESCVSCFSRLHLVFLRKKVVHKQT